MVCLTRLAAGKHAVHTPRQVVPTEILQDNIVMATPTRSQNVSTPKPHLSTPSRLMASPRPGTSGNSSRPLAYKSPAVKTPASLHGHHISVSSQPSSTPLAGAAVHDDLLAFNSPAAALMNSLGTTGLTPLGNPADGLGITTNLPGGPVRAAAAPLNPELERLHRAQLVVDTLKSRVRGHGITRDGVERIAQLEGFSTLGFDDTLTIAGNCVELEVNFEAGNRDCVRDVSLKLTNLSDNATESEESQFQEEGSQVIKDNLRGSTVVDGILQWRSLDAFGSNLQYLGQLDRIETGSTCFNAVVDLYHTFQKIWSAEKDRLKGRSAWQHLRQSTIGRPVMDRKPKLGLALDYWASGHYLTGRHDTSNEPAVNKGNDVYSAGISCEPGMPATAITRNWVSDRVLFGEAESILEADAVTFKPDWQDPAQDADSLLQEAVADEAAMEKSTDLAPTILDLHFYCALEPEVYLPLNVAANLNVEIPVLNIVQESTLTYQAALQKHSSHRGKEDVGFASAERWLRTLPVPMESDPERLRKHSYALHSTQNAPPLWCYPVSHLNFTHPKQIAAALPVLRQYVVLWGLLRSLVAYAGNDGAGQANGTASSKRYPGTPARPLKRTNKKPTGTKLEDLLQTTSALSIDEPLPIDLTLDFLLDPLKARLDLYIPIFGSHSRQQKSSFIFLGLSICPNGVIEVRDLRGLPASILDTSGIRKKVVRVLGATEDVGLTVEWLLEQASTDG